MNNVNNPTISFPSKIVNSSHQIKPIQSINLHKAIFFNRLTITNNSNNYCLPVAQLLVSKVYSQQLILVNFAVSVNYITQLYFFTKNSLTSYNFLSLRDNC